MVHHPLLAGMVAGFKRLLSSGISIGTWWYLCFSFSLFIVPLTKTEVGNYFPSTLLLLPACLDYYQKLVNSIRRGHWKKTSADVPYRLNLLISQLFQGLWRYIMQYMLGSKLKFLMLLGLSLHNMLENWEVLSKISLLKGKTTSVLYDDA